MSCIDEQYENIAGKYQITSPADAQYNCIAFAAGKTDEWWSFYAGYYWPVPSNRSPLAAALVAAFEKLGFEVCPTADVEAGYEKVALYERNGMWTHAARQLPSGKWMSKLGEDEDIEHDTADSICGAKYGLVHRYMRRKLA